jgi:hypothetical protein
MAVTYPSLRIAVLAALMATACTSLAVAQEELSAGPGLRLQINPLTASPTGCMLTFVAENRLQGDIEQAAFEVVLFDQDGLVERMTVLDFQTLPADRMRVRQFDVAGTDCTEISSVLINGVATCTGDGIDTARCAANLVTEARGGVIFSN